VTAHREATSSDTRTGSRSSIKISAILLTVVVLLAYSNSLGGPFIFDDTEIASSLAIRSLWPPWQSMFTPLYVTRPLVGLTIAINYAISGLNTWSYHALNLLIHLSAGLTLFGVVRRSLLMPALRDRFGERATELALVISMIWLVHPLQTQSVTYIIQRGESLMGLFYLLTLYFAIRSIEAQNRRLWTASAIVACIAGMMSKQVMTTAPLMVLLYDVLFEAGSLKTAIKSRWRLYLGLAASWGVLAATALAAPPSPTAGFGINKVSAISYFASQMHVISHYLWLCVWPAHLVLDYAWPPDTRAIDVAPYAVFIGGLCLLTIWALLKKRAAGFLGAWFFGILALTSSLLPIADIANEHRMYLSLAAVVSLVVLAAYRFWERWVIAFLPAARAPMLARSIAMSGVAAVVVTLLFLTMRRNVDYQSPLVIWQDVVNKRPENSRAHTNVGRALAELDRMDEAVEHFEAACKYDINSPSAHSNLGQALVALGRLEEGKRELMLALRIKPDYSYPHYNLGKVLAAEGKLDEAIPHFLAAVQSDPSHAEAYYNLGLSYEKENRLAEAINSYRQAVKLDQEWPEALSHLAMALANPGSTQEEALEASKLAARSAWLTSEQSPLALHALAVSYARLGRMADAVNVDKRALDLARTGGDVSLASVIEARLKGYGEGKQAQ
jgi:tetratricopeptide (TPR) repeat protein